MIIIDTDTLTNAELEEVGLPQPCDCRNMVEGAFSRECPDCGYYEELPEVRTHA